MFRSRELLLWNSLITGQHVPGYASSYWKRNEHDGILGTQDPSVKVKILSSKQEIHRLVLGSAERPSVLPEAESCLDSPRTLVTDGGGRPAVCCCLDPGKAALMAAERRETLWKNTEELPSNELTG